MSLKILPSYKIFSQLTDLDGNLWYVKSDRVCKFDNKISSEYLKWFLKDRDIVSLYERYTKFEVWSRKISKREIKYALNIHFMIQPTIKNTNLNYDKDNYAADKKPRDKNQVSYLDK